MTRRENELVTGKLEENTLIQNNQVSRCSTSPMFVQVLEAVRALEEGVLMDIREGDVGAILGWGFAPWSGGPLSWLDILEPLATERCKELSSEYGNRFEPPVTLGNEQNR